MRNSEMSPWMEPGIVFSGTGRDVDCYSVREDFSDIMLEIVLRVCIHI